MINKLKTFWFSFCDGSKPKGEQFLGVVITEGVDFKDAHRKTHKLGINPGGELKSIEIDPDTVKPEDFNKLLNKNDLENSGLI